MTEGTTRTIKIGTDSQDFHCLLLFHATLFHKKAFAFKNVVCPTIGRLSDKFKLFFSVDSGKERQDSKNTKNEPVEEKTLKQ
jgi:hypothetical protein